MKQGVEATLTLTIDLKNDSDLSKCRRALESIGFEIRHAEAGDLKLIAEKSVKTQQVEKSIAGVTEALTGASIKPDPWPRGIKVVIPSEIRAEANDFQASHHVYILRNTQKGICLIFQADSSDGYILGHIAYLRVIRSTLLRMQDYACLREISLIEGDGASDEVRQKARKGMREIEKNFWI